MSNQSPPATLENWKASPVIVAIVAGAAGYGFCYQFTMPTHTQALRNEIAVNAELVMKAKATEEKASSRAKDEDEKRSLLERQLKDALGRVKALEQSNLFSLGNPYPVGLGLVKIGQSVDDLEKAHPGAKIEKSSRYWSLREFHSVFTDVTYYFEEGSADKKITFITLSTSVRARDDGNFLQNKLLEVLGPPTEVPVANFASWNLAASKLAVYFDPRIVPSYMIMREGYTPNMWPRKAAPLATGATSPKK